MKYILVILSCLLLGPSSWAEADKAFEDMTLEDLLNVQVKVASKTGLTARQSPSIVSVITGEEIRNMGARDLIDVLAMIPGMWFGSDGYNTASFGVRGMWGAEAKVLLMIDDVPQNELLYGSTQLGNRYPVDQISRVEVIRGPGSVMYGGSAELAVINVITKNGADLKGCEFDVRHGQMRTILGRSTQSAACGKVIGETKISFAYYIGEGNRSERDYEALGYDSATVTRVDRLNMAKGSEYDPNLLNIGASSDDFDVRLIHEHYRTTSIEYGGWTEASRGIVQTFDNTNLRASYKIRPTEKLVITPILTYRRDNPWSVKDVMANAEGAQFWMDTTTERMQGQLQADYAFSDSFNVMLGYESYRDHAKNNIYPDYQFVTARNPSLSSQAVFAQTQRNFGPHSLILGGRYEDHSATKSAFVPRLALTSDYGKWHTKFLAAEAFRTPYIINVDVAGTNGIKPERTRTFELEAGSQISSKSYLTANIFSTEIKDPIVYGYVGNDELYFNDTRSATQGLELDYRWKELWGYWNLTYSFYKTQGDIAFAYAVPGHEDLQLAFPQHKATLNANFKAGSALRINPSLVYISEVYGYDTDMAAVAEVLKKQSPKVLANIFVTADNLLIKNLDIGAGVMNIFNQDYRFVQPYESGYHAPTPNPSVEWLVKASYRLGFE